MKRARDSEPDARSLLDLRGVGAATLRDLAAVGVTSVAQLAARDHRELYDALNARYKAARARGQFVGVNGLGAELDACVLDTLECAVAQAAHAPGSLPKEQLDWWFFSRRRKAAAAAAKAAAKAARASKALGAAAAPARKAARGTRLRA